MCFRNVLPKDMLTYDASRIFIREISIIPSYSTSELETNMALKLMLAKRINATQFISHRFKLKQIKEAFECAAQKKDSSMTPNLSFRSGH